MTIVVFTGPTLSAADVRAVLPDADVRPPAARGDVYRAARTRPAAIAIIDGRFDQQESVAHKEVLWALSERVPVLGAASMGALRAAELAPFGMQGVGAIFDAYRRGELEDDDEVAVAHGDAASGWRATSLAMVDIRATLAVAARSGAITELQQQSLVAAAKRLFYPDRIWPRIAATAAAAATTAITAALPPISQKRTDAELLLATLAAAPPAPPAIRWSFRPTVAWERLRRAIDTEPLTS